MFKDNDKLPWHKQFWPWFLITMPVLSVALGILMLVLATTTENSLVRDDYYKEGKAININIEKLRHAKELGIEAELKVSPDKVQLTFIHAEPEDKAALMLEFYHSTQEEKDVNVLLTRNLQGVYEASLSEPLQGKWQITLWPHHKEWKIQETIGLPQSGTIKLIP
ncbi:FixH family protein [Paraneptunicella aestuarii]|uniref:FixH family protein n=1 Tax=Paraneptunicella aestuarii TaxID=2831148 RepID=UPI001E51193C|nr:FixH family protein [Paraneptunicella aestuarii]UAA37109.1 FixH family protein [Paraneptunicella aestuarii]